MKQISILAISLGFIILNTAFAQNLVVNGGFESYSSLPVLSSEWYKCNSWTSVNGILSTPNVAFGTPDYYNANSLVGAGFRLPGSANGYIHPHSGTAIMGIITDNNSRANFREYLGNTLASAMVAGETYTVSFWLSNAEDTLRRKYGQMTNGFGIRFSTSPLAQSPTNGVINVNPQIEIPGLVWNSNWTLYSFSYVATSAWTHITIGNFSNDANTAVATGDAGARFPTGAYYFIDDVSIVVENPLPVELISFSATHQDNAVALAWTTSSEKDNNYFTIQRSDDLEEWHAIGEIPGAGNSGTESSYQVTDKDPVSGLSYYRLQQTDYNGKTSFSGLRAVNIKTFKSPILYPNPATNRITIKADWKHVGAYSIVDHFGRDLTNMVRAYPGSNDVSKEFDLSVLPKGIYYFVSNSSKQKIVKL